MIFTKAMLQTAVMAFCGAATYDLLRIAGAIAWKRARAWAADWYVHYKFEKQAKMMIEQARRREELRVAYEYLPLECCGKTMKECTCPVDDGIETVGRCVA